jgi:hypothetical protein
MISRGLADEGTQERWHDGTEARAGASEGPSGPTHEPAQGGLSGWDANPYLFDNPAISINDSAPDLVATAHRQATQAGMLPLPCLDKAGHQSQPHATA